jgi:hypothetical protein
MRARQKSPQKRRPRNTGPNGRRNLGTTPDPQSGFTAETSGSELSERGVELGALAGETFDFSIDHRIVTVKHLIQGHFHQADLDQKIVVDRNRIHSQRSQLCIHDELSRFLIVALGYMQIVCQVTFQQKFENRG